MTPPTNPTDPNFFVRSKIRKIARPVLEVFLAGQASENISRLMEIIASKTYALPEEGDKGSFILRNSFTRKVQISENSPPNIYLKAIAGFLDLRDYNVMSEAFSRYIVALQHMTKFTESETDRFRESTQKNFRRSYFSRFFPCEESEINGKAIGIRAALIEAEHESDQRIGLGLFYLREVNKGIDLKQAEEKTKRRKLNE